MNSRLIVIFLIMLCHPLFSQERNIIARIVESGTEKPIKDANISIPGTTAETFSNHLGYFELTVDRTKHTTLQISHISYKILQIQIPAADRFKLYLEKDSLLLNALNLAQFPKPDAGASDVKSNPDSLAAESEAMFPGGVESFYSYMGNALAPLLPQVNATGFQVIFTINETGQAVDLSFSDSTESIKASVINAFQKMPAWIPATQRQKKVKQLFVLPVKRFNTPALQVSDLRELYSFLNKTIRYPVEARRMGIEGTVFMQFDTDKLGNVSSIKLLKGLDESCNTEVKRVISLMPVEYLKSLSEKTQRNEFILPVFFGLGGPLKTGRNYVPNSDAYMLPPADLFAGGLTVVRREIGGSARTVSQVPMEPQVITYLTLDAALNEQKTAKRLMLKHSNLTLFPTEILQLTELTFLDLENNQIQTLPSEIDVLTDLKELYLPDNKLTSLPDNFGNLKKLKTLGLARNQLNSFPISIISLEKLEELDLSSNQLSALPPEIGLMKNLEVLLLMSNNIKSIPPEFYGLKKLKKIYLQGNPINPNDIELLKKTFKKAEINF